MAAEIITRKEALAKGLRRFFSGRPCRRGHIAEQYVSTWRCIECMREDNISDIYRSRRNAKRSTPEGKAARHEEAIKRRDIDREYRRDRYNNDPEFKERRQISAATYEKTEKGKQKRKGNKARRRTRPEVKEQESVYGKGYRATERGKEVHRASQARRNARQYGNGGDISVDDIERLKQLQKKCYLCGKRFTKTLPPTIEHIIPLAKGGAHDITNIMLACGPCNSSKGDTILQLL